MKSQKHFQHYVRHEVVEVNNLPDMTEPQQVQPLETILEHRSRGIPVPIFNGTFSEQDTPDIQKMDFVEIAELRETTLAGIEQATEDYHALSKRLYELENQKEPEKPKTEDESTDESKPSNKTP